MKFAAARRPPRARGALALAAGVALVVGGGCASKSRAPGRVPTLNSAVIGRSVENRPIACFTLGRTDGRGGAHGLRIMFIASIHGDEPAGTPLVQRLLAEALADPPWMNDRTLVLIADANPDGLAHDRRGNMRGVDLNRNFPASSFSARRRHGSQPLSEPESRALHEAILHHRPHRIISIHQPLSCIDYDGPALELAQAMAAAMPREHALPVRKLGAYPGSLGSFAGEDLGIPIITLELPPNAHRLDDETLWQRYGAMLIAAIALEGLPPSSP